MPPGTFEVGLGPLRTSEGSIFQVNAGLPAEDVFRSLVHELETLHIIAKVAVEDGCSPMVEVIETLLDQASATARALLPVAEASA